MSIVKILFSIFATIISLKGVSQNYNKNQFKKKEELIIRGKINSLNYSIPYVYAIFLGGELDSAKVINGKYEFKNKIRFTTLITLFSKRPSTPESFENENSFVILVEPKLINITSTNSFENVKIQGSKAYIDFKELETKREEFILKLQPLQEGYQKAKESQDTLLIKMAERKVETLRNDIANMYYLFTVRNPLSFAKPFALDKCLFWLGKVNNPKSEIRKVEIQYNKLSLNDKKSILGIGVKKGIESFKVNEGVEAPNFNQNDTLGNSFSLESFKGKYLLLDFWASWCGPCRKNNPILKTYYSKYKNKGFEIISISADNNLDNWKNAIQKDSMDWVNLSDLNGWDNEILKKYRVNSLPTYVLVDPYGIIKLRVGNDIDKVVSEINRIYKE
ncbi:MAG: AhpC/TSA family protein [Bacteroidetes bacterium]|nr:AhpC/TSA family protein [Bacteroidota bacterium]